jgi:hypothetical protein
LSIIFVSASHSSSNRNHNPLLLFTMATPIFMGYKKYTKAELLPKKLQRDGWNHTKAKHSHYISSSQESYRDSLHCRCIRISEKQSAQPAEQAIYTFKNNTGQPDVRMSVASSTSMCMTQTKIVS